MPLPGGKGKGEAPPAGSGKGGRGGVVDDVAAWPAMPSTKKPPADPDYRRDGKGQGKGQLWTGGPSQGKPLSQMASSFAPAQSKGAAAAPKPVSKQAPASKNKPKTGQGMNLSDMLGDFAVKGGQQLSKQSKKQASKPAPAQSAEPSGAVKGRTYVQPDGTVTKERGKEREVKKAKKPTRIKKLILQERGIKGKYHKARLIQQRRMELLADIEAATEAVEEDEEAAEGEGDSSDQRQEPWLPLYVGEGEEVGEAPEGEPTVDSAAAGSDPAVATPDLPEESAKTEAKTEAKFEAKSEAAMVAEADLKALDAEAEELWSEVEEDIDQLETALEALRNEIGAGFDRNAMEEGPDLATRREETKKMEERANHKALFRNTEEFEAAKKLMVKERATVMYLEKEETLGAI